MKRKLQMYFDSFKSSVKTKPMALAMFFLVVFVTTFCIGFLSRMVLREYIPVLYPDSFELISREGEDVKFDYDIYDGILTEMKEKKILSEDYYVNYKFITQAVLKNKDGVVYDEKGLILDAKYPDKVFTREQIASGERIIALGDKIMERLSVEIGDNVYIESLAYKVVRKTDRDIIVPSKFIKELTSGDLQYLRINIVGIDKKPGGKYTEQFAALNLDMKFWEVGLGVIMQYLVMSLIVIGICVLCLLNVLNYWQKINKRKYAVYKIIGASNWTVTLLMFLETIIFTAIGVGCGLLVDYALSIDVLNVSSDYDFKIIEWLHYLLVTAVSFVTVVVTVGVSAYIRAKASPVDRKGFS